MAVKQLFVIRHCSATGQEPDAPLTAEGLAQAEALATHLETAGIDRIVSSPMLRARQTAAPLARRLGLPVEMDDRLSERVLSSTPRPDWLARLEDSFADHDLCLEGGESLRTAMARIGACVEEIWQGSAAAPAIVTHGALMAALLVHYDPAFGFAGWRALTNPDLFRLRRTAAGVEVIRLWGDR